MVVVNEPEIKKEESNLFSDVASSVRVIYSGISDVLDFVADNLPETNTWSHYMENKFEDDLLHVGSLFLSNVPSKEELRAMARKAQGFEEDVQAETPLAETPPEAAPEAPLEAPPEAPPEAQPEETPEVEVEVEVGVDEEEEEGPTLQLQELQFVRNYTPGNTLHYVNAEDYNETYVSDLEYVNRVIPVNFISPANLSIPQDPAFQLEDEEEIIEEIGPTREVTREQQQTSLQQSQIAQRIRDQIQGQDEYSMPTQGNLFQQLSQNMRELWGNNNNNNRRETYNENENDMIEWSSYTPMLYTRSRSNTEQLQMMETARPIVQVPIQPPIPIYESSVFPTRTRPRNNSEYSNRLEQMETGTNQPVHIVQSMSSLQSSFRIPISGSRHTPQQQNKVPVLAPTRTPMLMQPTYQLQVPVHLGAGVGIRNSSPLISTSRREPQVLNLTSALSYNFPSLLPQKRKLNVPIEPRKIRTNPAYDNDIIFSTNRNRNKPSIARPRNWSKMKYNKPAPPPPKPPMKVKKTQKLNFKPNFDALLIPTPPIPTVQERLLEHYSKKRAFQEISDGQFEKGKIPKIDSAPTNLGLHFL